MATSIADITKILTKRSNRIRKDMAVTSRVVSALLSDEELTRQLVNAIETGKSFTISVDKARKIADLVKNK